VGGVIALLDTGRDLRECQQEIGVPVGQLLTPLTRYRLRDPLLPWAIDNGAFSGLDWRGLRSLMDREAHHKERCLFVVVPDVVASAQRTAEMFDHFAPLMDGWPLALACQDGHECVSIPWGRINAVFIGGSTDWKMSHHVRAIVTTAKAMGKWTHVGRVNTPERFLHFEAMGVDSCDGSGIARYTHMREAVAQRHDQLTLEVTSGNHS
jgi:hypothetical protein